MVVITKLSLQNIRSHNELTASFSPNVTIITGKNGTGKTSIIESIYLSLRGTSFKGTDEELLRTDKKWWKIQAELTDETKRTITYNSENNQNKKQFIVDDKTTYRLPQKEKYPVVLFDPDDLRLIHGSPSRRRQYIDRFIGQLNPLYTTSLHKYERALRQRNNLLKQPTTNDALFVWDVAISEYGSYIIEQRIEFIEQINSQLSDVYSKIAKKTDNISVHYSHTFIGDIKQKILNELHQNTEKDKILGNTSVGPHRHDVVFHFNDSPALTTASRGEIRTIILALKFLEVDIVEKITEKKPIILLDDVFSELDETRQQALSNSIKKYQTIITTTHLIPGKNDYKQIQL